MTDQHSNGELALNDGQQAEIATLVSALLDRQLFAARAGLTFGGARDMYNALGYKLHPVFDDYLARYKRQDIAKRVINAPVQATWRSAPEIFDDEDPENETPFEAAWNELQRRLRIFQRLQRVDRLAGLGQYAVMMIGMRGQPDSSLEAVPVAGPDGVLFLQPFTERNAQIRDFDEDPQSERFGRPLIYDLQIKREGGARQVSTSLPTHHSRVIHVVEPELEDEVFGEPRLAAVYNLLDDLLKVVGGSAETFWLEARRGIHAKTDARVKPLSADAKKQLSDQVDEYIHNLRRFIGTDGIDLTTIGNEADVSDPRGPFNSIISLISSATGIPQRVLTGSERGELSSVQDDRNWADRVEERREQFAEPMILRPLVDRLIELNALPEPTDGQYDVRWASLSDPGEREQADTAEVWARAAATLQGAGAIVSPEEARERYLGLDPDETPAGEELEQD